MAGQMNKLINLSLCMGLLFSCSAVKIDLNSQNEIEILDFIIDDIDENYSNNYFKDTNIIVITKDGIENKYSAYRKSYIDYGGSEVFPDSVYYFLNSYQELNGKIYFFESNSKKVERSLIYRKMTDYGVKTDSCFYKYQYVTSNPKQFTRCIDERHGGGPVIMVDRALEHEFLIDENEKFIQVKKRKYNLNN
jgi:hypothetical protein